MYELARETNRIIQFSECEGKGSEFYLSEQETPNQLLLGTGESFREVTAQEGFSTQDGGGLQLLSKGKGFHWRAGLTHRLCESCHPGKTNRSWETERGGARGLQKRSLVQPCISQKSPRRPDVDGRVERGGAQRLLRPGHLQAAALRQVF